MLLPAHGQGHCSHPKGLAPYLITGTKRTSQGHQDHHCTSCPWPPTEAGSQSGSKKPKMLQLQPHILKTIGTEAFPAPRAHSGWTYHPNTPPAPGGTKGQQLLISGVLLQSCSRAGAGCFEFPTLLRCNERDASLDESSQLPSISFVSSLTGTQTLCSFPLIVY